MGKPTAIKGSGTLKPDVVIVNNSLDSDYNKQRDNQVLPLETCGPTSMVMAVLQSGYKLPIENFDPKKDPADSLTEFLMTEEAYERMYTAIGQRNTHWKPFNIHAVLSWGINTLMGQNLSQFRTSWRLRDILFVLVKKGGAVLAGDFSLPDGRELGHMVSFSGFTTTQKNIFRAENSSSINMGAIESYIIDDPYGNWHTGYRDHHGNNIELSPSQFESIFRERGNPDSKWAHVIKPSS